MERSDFDSTLRKLFEIGDERIDDLIAALDDPDKTVALNAQIVLRDLGNKDGVKAIYEGYKKSNVITISLGSAIPLPINDFEFKRIDQSLKSKELMDSQLYALIFDNSEKSNQYLDRLMESGIEKELPVAQIRKSFAEHGDLPNAVLKNGFFLTEDAKRNSLARLMAYNKAKNRALIYVKTNFGPLMEAWYHVIVQKDGKGWKFVSVVQTAVS